ncbi:MAG: hypothetical protein EPN91_07180 [Salinibacterium sp.]|nr:MAG: hypothetical protein EPN91_07180 [Salinibacterium sp.]
MKRRRRTYFDLPQAEAVPLRVDDGLDVPDDDAFGDGYSAEFEEHRLAFLRPKSENNRAYTISGKPTVREVRAAALITYPEVARPEVRGECLQMSRPCPFVSCSHHLYLDVNPENGNIKLNFPNLEVWELKQTCSLDVADRGGATLEEIGDLVGLTRERVRQVEVMALASLKVEVTEPDDDGP